jgi:hypothetical protein
VQKYGDVDADDIRMKLDAIKQEPKERVQNILNVLINCFKGARYKTQNKEGDFWPD